MDTITHSITQAGQSDRTDTIDPGGNRGDPPTSEMLKADKNKPKVKTGWEKFTDWFFGDRETRDQRHRYNVRTELSLAHRVYSETLDSNDVMYLEHIRKGYEELGAIGRSSTDEAWKLFLEPAVNAALGGSLVAQAMKPAHAIVGTGGAIKGTIETTLHGTERIAGPAATRGGVLSSEGIEEVVKNGRTLAQNNGATVYFTKEAGKWNAAVFSAEGRSITTMEGWGEKAIAKIARKFGWE